MGSCRYQTQRHVGQDATPIFNLTRRTGVCERAVSADRPLRRMRGLLGRRSLPAGEGLLLRSAPSVHTAFMRFPIDVVFLDRNLTVVKLVERMRPWRVASARQARAALELAAGEAEARGIQIGDKLSLVAGAGHSGVAEPFARSNDSSVMPPELGDSAAGDLRGWRPSDGER
jgi:uncharacterized membrane protein (UPF0127 family)